MPKWKMMVCDFNGTLLDDLWIVYKSVRRIFAAFDVYPVPTLTKFRNQSCLNYMEEFYYKNGIPRDGSKDMKKELNQIRHDYFKMKWNDVHLNRGAHLFLEKCKKSYSLKTGIVSGEDPKILEERIKQFELFYLVDFFEGGVPSKEEVFIRKLKEFKIEPTEAVYIDDTYEGVIAAKTVGMVTIGYYNGYQSYERVAEARPDFMVKSFQEALELVENNSKN